MGLFCGVKLQGPCCGYCLIAHAHRAGWFEGSKHKGLCLLKLFLLGGEDSSAISRGLNIIDALVGLRHSKVQCDELEKICLCVCLV